MKSGERIKRREFREWKGSNFSLALSIASDPVKHFTYVNCLITNSLQAEFGRLPFYSKATDVQRG